MSVIVTCPSWCTTNHLAADKAHRTRRSEMAYRRRRMVVTLDADIGPNLTPQRAREVGLHLLEAATLVEDHRDD